MHRCLKTSLYVTNLINACYLLFGRCHEVLESKGINLTKIIMDSDPTIYDDILNSFIGIVAVLIGLTDILKTIAIEPDYIIGNVVKSLKLFFRKFYSDFIDKSMSIPLQCEKIVY